MKKLILILGFLGSLYGQSVSGQTAINGQTATFSLGVKKIPKLTATITCNAPVDSTGTYQVVAGTSVACIVTVNLAAPTGGATLTLASSDTTQFTVPASVVIAAGGTTGAFQLTATP
jgi:hypothetical protein